ncbi:hypothetical protein QOT17_009473 [Balamuthia mandrillaris]
MRAPKQAGRGRGAPAAAEHRMTEQSHPNYHAQQHTEDFEAMTPEFELILPRLLDTLKAIGEGNETDVIKTTNQLNLQFQRCYRLLEELPGSDLTEQQQRTKYQHCQNILQRKTGLLTKYQALPAVLQLKNLQPPQEPSQATTASSGQLTTTTTTT